MLEYDNWTKTCQLNLWKCLLEEKPKENFPPEEHLVKDCKLTETETNLYVCANCGGKHRSSDTNCEVLQFVEARKNAKNKL